YMQIIPPGSRSGKHRHLAEECLYVLEGRGYDLHQDCDVERSEEHTSELQSLTNLVCRLLLEKKKQHPAYIPRSTHAIHDTLCFLAARLFCYSSPPPPLAPSISFFNATPPPPISPLSLHDALPISTCRSFRRAAAPGSIATSPRSACTSSKAAATTCTRTATS